MIDVLIGVVIGLFVGWTIPQPQWATNLIIKIKRAFSR